MGTSQPESAVFDVVVVGGGMAGMSLAAELASDLRVGVLEQESELAFHATGRSAAVFLGSYGNHTVRALSAASRNFFVEPPQQFTDAPLSTPQRLMIIASERQTQSVHTLYTELGDLGAEVELVDGTMALQLNPVLRPGHTQLALVDHSARELDVHAIHQGYLGEFRRRGGTVCKSAQLVAARREKSIWTVTDAAGRTFRAATVVNAAGAWCDRVASVFGAAPIGIQPLRRSAFMVRRDGDHSASVPVTMGAAEDFYFKPDGSQFLCSPADETPQEPGDARPDDLEIARAIELINDATTLAIRSVRSSWAGLRSFVPDRSPVVGPDPVAEGLFWFAGQGGYGIQMAPALARFGAACLRGGQVPNDLLRNGFDATAVGPDRLLCNR